MKNDTRNRAAASTGATTARSAGKTAASAGLTGRTAAFTTPTSKVVALTCMAAALVLVLALVFAGVPGTAMANDADLEAADSTAVDKSITVKAGDFNSNSTTFSDLGIVVLDPAMLTTRVGDYQSHLARWCVLADISIFNGASMTIDGATYTFDDTSGYAAFLNAYGFQDIKFYSQSDLLALSQKAGVTGDAADITNVLIAHKPLTMDGASYEAYVVVIRGTDGSVEWSSNLDFGADCDAYKATSSDAHTEWFNHANHKGFDVTATRVDRALSQYMGAYGDKTATKTVLVTGHSRGGSIANILGADYQVNKVGHRSGSTEYEAAAQAYCNSAPGVTDGTDKCNKDCDNVYNIVNVNDLLANECFQAIGLYRYGTDITGTTDDGASSETFATWVSNIPAVSKDATATATQLIQALVPTKNPTRTGVYTEAITSYAWKYDGTAADYLAKKNMIDAAFSGKGIGYQVNPVKWYETEGSSGVDVARMDIRTVDLLPLLTTLITSISAGQSVSTTPFVSLGLWFAAHPPDYQKPLTYTNSAGTAIPPLNFVINTVLSLNSNPAAFRSTFASPHELDCNYAIAYNFVSLYTTDNQFVSFNSESPIVMRGSSVQVTVKQKLLAAIRSYETSVKKAVLTTPGTEPVELSSCWSEDEKCYVVKLLDDSVISTIELVVAPSPVDALVSYDSEDLLPLMENLIASEEYGTRIEGAQEVTLSLQASTDNVDAYDKACIESASKAVQKAKASGSLNSNAVTEVPFSVGSSSDSKNITVNPGAYSNAKFQGNTTITSILCISMTPDLNIDGTSNDVGGHNGNNLINVAYQVDNPEEVVSLSVIREHGGEFEQLGSVSNSSLEFVDYDVDAGQVEVCVCRFSTYAIVIERVADSGSTGSRSTTTVPNTGNEGYVLWTGVMLAVAGIGALTVFASRSERRRRD